MGKLESIEDFNEALNSGKVKNPINLYKISSKYGNRGTGFHNGFDIPAPTGTKLYAPYDGEVTLSNYNDLGGYQLIITSGIVKFGFAHLREKSFLNVGDIVKAGQLVGYVGNTGRSTGSHLHFTLTIDGKKVDPATYFKSYK